MLLTHKLIAFQPAHCNDSLPREIGNPQPAARTCTRLPALLCTHRVHLQHRGATSCQNQTGRLLLPSQVVFFSQRLVTFLSDVAWPFGLSFAEESGPRRMPSESALASSLSSSSDAAPRSGWSCRRPRFLLAPFVASPSPERAPEKKSVYRQRKSGMTSTAGMYSTRDRKRPCRYATDGDPEQEQEHTQGVS